MHLPCQLDYLDYLPSQCALVWPLLESCRRIFHSDTGKFLLPKHNRANIDPFSAKATGCERKGSARKFRSFSGTAWKDCGKNDASSRFKILSKRFFVAKILLVDDDQALTKMVRDWLVFDHHQVEIASDGNDGLYKILTYAYDIIILDLNMPGKDGIEICSQYRAKGGQCPILMLTGRDKIEHKEEGFNSGADDYLTKPFHMKELTVRIQALLRRARTVAEKSYSWGDVKLDSTSFKVTKGDTEVKLLPKEFGLLEFLMSNPNRVFTPDAILDRLWASESDATSNAVITCISRIRTKLDDKGTKNSIIKTVHGVGYRFDP